MDPFEKPPSPAKNFLGGGGCGCGCVGLLLMLFTGVFLTAYNMRYIQPESATYMIYYPAGFTILAGLVMVGLGFILWIGSVLVD